MQSFLRRGLAALFLAGAAVAAAAQTAPRSFAVVSEFAREINVVTFQESTGTRLNNNLRSGIPIANGALEKVALLATRQAIAKAEAGAGTWLVAPLDTDLFDALGAYIEGSAVKLPDDLAAEMKRRGNTHLLLLTRLRAEAELKAVRTREGTGQLEGLGFFVDRLTEGKNIDTGELSRGFLAPFMHVRATLVDASSGRVVAMQRIVQSTVYANTRGDARSADPWDAMKPDEKVRYLAAMIERELATALPLLLAKR